MQGFDFERIFENWLQSCGTPARSKKWRSKYQQIPIDQRRDALVVLVTMIKDAGKEEEYFTPSKRDEIVEAIIPFEKSLGSAARHAAWKNGARADLRAAISIVYVPKLKVEQQAIEERAEIDPSKLTERMPEKAPAKRNTDLDELFGSDDER